MTTPNNTLIDMDTAGMSVAADAVGIGSPTLGLSATSAESVMTRVLLAVDDPGSFDVDLLQELALGVSRL